MHPGAIDVRHEMREQVELTLMTAPVVLVAPVGNQRIQIVRIAAALPSGVGENAHAAPAMEARAQIVQHLPGDADAKRLR
jgi:hypothetical protein